ncbi:MAG: hypothetical protein ACKPKO_00455, partial [Candidatus Fonsibacter sp.]
MAFAEDLLYGKRYDQHLKALRRAGQKHITAIDTFPGLMEPLYDVKTLQASEQKNRKPNNR